ncbi:MAG: T9SS type A sorting domain-containing protein [Bacteroidales bacterium]|nr:T9SS type A sorting domain-containing protein [Bacteroidales bacterium]
MKKIILLLVLSLGLNYWGWGQKTASATVNSRPSYIDLSSATAEGAVLMTCAGYSQDDARYRLYNGSNQYYCWDATTSTYISSTSYSSGPRIPGTPSTSSTFWIVFQRGNNNATTASYRDRLGSGYSTNYQTVALPAATSILVSFTLSGNFIGTGNYSTDVKRVVLAYNGSSILVSAASTALTTGAFSVVCPNTETITKIEIRAIDNSLITSLTGTWNSTTNLGYFSAPTTQASNITFSGISTTGMIPSWTNGDGSKRIVIMNTSNSFTDPTDGTDPSANPVYGGSGEQVVYNNSSNTVTISGLTASTTYWFRVYEYNGSGVTTKYLVTTATGNPISQATNGSVSVPTIISPTATTISNNSATLGGNITLDGGDAITTRGTVWNTSSGVLVTDNPLAEGGAATGVFSHSRSSLPAKTLIYYKAYATNSIGTSLTDESSFYTLADEPSDHVTGFAAASGGTTSINLSWTGTATGADGYIILQKVGGTAPTGTPSDATAYIVGNTIGDGTVAAIVTNGAQTSQSISGLTPITQYSFTIMPYAWDATNAQTYNYRTSATIPSASATTDEPSATAYTWNVASGNWNTSASWTPERTTPAANDILVFDGSIQATPTVTLDFTSPQSIGRLRIINNASVTFGTSAETRTLNIGYTGASSPQLEVGSGSTLTVSAVNAITVNVLTGFTGNISGNIIYQNAAHRLTAIDASGITFNNGGVFTAGTSFTGSPFGSGTGNSVIFSSGSTYVQQAGSNPFAATTAIVTFQTGSLFRLEGNLTPSFSGRTYANFELNYNGPISASGALAVLIDNLTITQGTFNFNVSGTPGHSINGNIYVASGATLTFSPSSAGSVTLNGSATQTISGDGTLSTSGNSTLVINNTVVTNKNITFGGNLTINSSKSFTINAGKNVTVSGTLTNTENSGLVIKSGGSLKQNTGSVPATVERDITAWSDATHGWHFISSPVAEQAVDPSFTDPTPVNYDFFTWWQPTNQWVNFKNTEVAPTWNTANVLGVTSGGTNFIPGKGYLVAYSATATKQFSGTLNVADIAVSNLSVNASNYGWHLLGNPFPCALTWNDGNWAMTAINGTAKIWSESGAAYTDIAASGIIPALNGFMVEATAVTNGLTIPLASRTHDATSWYKSNSGPYIKLVAHDPDGQTAQESIILFTPDATTGFDPQYDSHFLPGYAPAFYSVAGEEHLSTNALPEAGGAVQIPFNFTKNEGSNFTIEAKEITGVYGPIMLNDLKAGTSQDLGNSPLYSFIASAEDTPGRFVITFSHVGIGEAQNENPVRIYTNGNCICVANACGTAITGDVVVYNLMGQQLTKTRLGGATLTRIDLDPSTGYYLVKVITPQKTYTNKVFIR